MRRATSTGVIAGVTNEMLVYADSTGMQVKVKTGEVWIEGHWGQISVEKPVAVATAHATLTRLDRVIARADFDNNRIEADILTNASPGSTTPPALTQNTSIWEISLALVSIPALDTGIDAGQVTDQRTWGIAHTRHNATASASITVGTGGLKIPFGTIQFANDDVSVNSSSDIFTLNKAGVWTVNTAVRWASASSGWRILHVSDSTDANIYVSDTLPYGGTAVIADQSTTTTRRFPAGQTISVWGFTNSGTTTVETGTPNHVRTNIALTRVGP